MGGFLSYSIISGLLMLAMYLAYRLFLARDNQHGFNRGVLLGIYVVSFLALPAMSLSENPASQSTAMTLSVNESGWTDVIPATHSEPVWGTILIWIFLAGMIVVTVRTVIVWAKLLAVIRSGEKIIRNGYTLVVTEDERYAPFSWMNYMVISRKDYENNCSAIAAHELKHIVARHWIDLLIAQAVCIIGWFNPAAWLMRDELMLIHEYQADIAVIEKGHDPQEYQMLLIKKAVGARFPSLANSLNHSKLKKRITMMLKSKSSKSRRMRALALVPAIAVAVAVVNTPFMTRALDAMHDSTAETFSDVDKVSENNVTDATPATEIDGMKGSIAAVTKNESETPAKSAPKVNDKKEEITINIDDKHAKGEVKVYVNGKLYTKDLKNISPEEIKSITVNKKGEDAIYVTLYKDGEKRASANPGAGQSEPLKVVNVASEKMPQFPGGESVMMQWLVQNLKFPKSEMNNAGTHRVVVQFVVETDGSIGETKVIRSQGEAFDAEAQRVVKAMPKWIPGEIDGKPAAVYYTLPVSFKVDAPKKNESKK